MNKKETMSVRQNAQLRSEIIEIFHFNPAPPFTWIYRENRKSPDAESKGHRRQFQRLLVFFFERVGSAAEVDHRRERPHQAGDTLLRRHSHVDGEKLEDIASTRRRHASRRRRRRRPQNTSGSDFHVSNRPLGRRGERVDCYL